MRMSKARRNLSLAMEACQGLLVGGQVARHYFDGHALVKSKLDGLVHGAHATFAD